MGAPGKEINTVVTPFVTGLRWLAFVPVALVSGFTVGAAFHGAYVALGGSVGGLWPPIAYVIAFLSGLIYVWLALFVAHTIAPSFKVVVVVVLGFFLLGDLIFVHLILPNIIASGTVSSTLESDIGLILSALRAEDYAELRHGGFTRIMGALTASFLIWREYIRRATA